MIPASLLIASAWLSCVQWIAAVVLFTVSVSFSGFFYSASFLSFLDIAPQFAGFLMGVSAAVANLSKIAASAAQESIVVQVET